MRDSDVEEDGEGVTKKDGRPPVHAQAVGDDGDEDEVDERQAAATPQDTGVTNARLWLWLIVVQIETG